MRADSVTGGARWSGRSAVGLVPMRADGLCAVSCGCLAVSPWGSGFPVRGLWVGLGVLLAGPGFPGSGSLLLREAGSDGALPVMTCLRLRPGAGPSMRAAAWPPPCVK